MGIFPLPISRFRSTLRNPRSPVLPRTGLLLFVSKQATSALADGWTYFNVKSMFAKCEMRALRGSAWSPARLARFAAKNNTCQP